MRVRVFVVRIMRGRGRGKGKRKREGRGMNGKGLDPVRLAAFGNQQRGGRWMSHVGKKKNLVAVN